MTNLRAALQEILDLQMGKGDGVVGDYISDVREIARAALAPAALDPVTVERCAKVVEQSDLWDNNGEIAAAIRALIGQPRNAEDQR